MVKAFNECMRTHLHGDVMQPLSSRERRLRFCVTAKAICRKDPLPLERAEAECDRHV